MIEEKLQERKMRWEREMEQQQAEQSQMIAEQDKAIKQVLNTQAGLAEEYVQTKKCRCNFGKLDEEGTEMPRLNQ